MQRLFSLLLLIPLASSAGPATGAVSAGRDDAAGFATSPAAPRVRSSGALPGAAGLSRAVVSLREELARLIQEARQRGDEWSVLVVSLDRGDTLFAHAADVALVPASNMKLFTSAAALYYLGPDFRYGTYLLSDGTIENGVLRGDLIIYGTGDPTISDRFYASKLAAWEQIADTLLALGVRQIDGDIVGDASYFGGVGTGLGWRESYMNATYAAPASSLSFNDNIVTLHVRPAAQAGAHPTIQLVPGGEGIAIVNQATTVTRGRSWIDVTRAAYDGPIVVRGQISRQHSGLWRAVPVADPARYAATVFREVLAAKGVLVSGQPRSVQRPEDSPVTGRSVFAPAFDDAPPLHVLAVHRSPTLLEILEVVNKKSHNLYAEQVLRTVGRVAAGDGTVEGGARAVRHLMERETGPDSLALEIYDGSGLSPYNRVSAGGLVRLLGYMAASTMADSYFRTLPLAGTRDGLRRMYRTPAEGRLLAKTGTIEHVSALSGYVQNAEGERIAFSIISNNVPSTWRAKRVEDAIGARLAAFRRDVAGDAVAPSELAPEAPPAPPAPAQPTSTPSARYHRIRKGDTFDALARRYGTTVRALQAANPGVSPRRLIPGRRIRLSN